MPLTDVQMKQLELRKDRYALSDGRGLALEVMPTGAKSWRFRCQFKGKTEKITLGQYPLLDLKEARTKRDECAMAVFRGESPARQKQLEKVALASASSVKDFCERYFTEVIKKDRKDAAQLRRYLEKEIYLAFGLSFT